MARCERAVERCNLAKPESFGRGGEIGLSEIKPRGFVQLHGSKKHRLIDDGDPGVGKERPARLRNPRAGEAVDRVEHVDDLGQNQIGQEDLMPGSKERRGPPGLGRRVAGDMPDEDVRVDEDPHGFFPRILRSRDPACLRHACARTLGHAMPVLPGGGGMVPARSRKSGTFASTARSSWTRNSTRSPDFRPRASRTDFGSVI